MTDDEGNKLFALEVRRMTVEIMEHHPGCSEHAARGYAYHLVATARALLFKIDYATRHIRRE